MKIFLTSLGFVNKRVEGEIVDCDMDKQNDFVNLVRKHLTKRENFFYIPSSFDNFEYNDISLKYKVIALEKEGLLFNNIAIIDDRNLNNAKDLIKKADLIFLSGGDVILQNDNFKKIKLKENLNGSHAVIIGVSAGSMNCAERVYNYPEIEEQKNYPKFIDGLGLTNINIIPHFNKENGNDLLEGDIDLLNEYYLPDSYKTTLYGLPNGSYIFVNDEKPEYHGDIYVISKGQINKLDKKYNS